MSKWTNDALEALEGYLERNRGRVARSGADVDEVVADLRRHVEEEVTALELPVVTQDDVHRIVSRLGPVPVEEREDDRQAKPAAQSFVTRVFGSGSSLAMLFFGVVLPLITIGFELVTRLCAGALFDPMPTLMHTVLVGLVPLANTAAWLVVYRKQVPLSRGVWLANGAALGISLFYSALFLPMLPFAALGIIFFGLGLVPLTPYCALICAWRLRILLRRQWLATRAVGLADVAGSQEAFFGRSMQPVRSRNGHSNGHSRRGRVLESGIRERSQTGGDRFGSLRGWGWTLMAPLILLLAFALPGPLTRHWLGRAGSESYEESARAVQWLRMFGSQDILLRECYGRGNRLWIETFGARQPNAELAQKTFYRVTGKPYNTLPPPVSKYQPAGRAMLGDFDWDSGLGGQAVAGRVRGLSLIESRLDGACRPDQGWTYLEWIMEFENVHPTRQREARAQIQLPPGGVVSRVTLWVNGEEREAAFAGRSHVREAYQRVAVIQRRDPVLVTTSGPDRVLVQCFPIQPRGGTMKVRLGITAPLIVESPDSAALKLPSILERNYGLKDSVRHRLWLESPEPSSGLASLIMDTPKSGKHGLRGELTDADLNSGNALLRFPLSSKARVVRAKDRKSENGSIIRQRVEPIPAKMPARLAIVLDGAEDMNGAFPRIARALDGLPSQPELAVWLAQDGVRQLYNTAWSSPEPISSTVGKLRGVGGQDDLPALLQAWEWADGKEDGVVLWIHGAQPVLLGGVEALKQRLEWRSNGSGPAMLEVAVAPGPNRITEELSNLDAITSVARLGELESDLERLFATWSGRRAEFRLVRELETIATPGADEVEAGASSHVVRLWAQDRIRMLAKARRVSEAIQLAGLYQLVTPVSGAVVLETAQQFAEAGLTPVDPLTVPTIPEPSTWALALVAALALVFYRKVQGWSMPPRDKNKL